MELGCDAICEKPLTIDEGRGPGIFEVMHRTKCSLRVTFNYRYVPHATKLRELMMQQVISHRRWISVGYSIRVTDYFRRWHRDKANSGGLLIHKASHHFDLINWWSTSRRRRCLPWAVSKFYGRRKCGSEGEKYTYPRYTGYPVLK